MCVCVGSKTLKFPKIPRISLRIFSCYYTQRTDKMLAKTINAVYLPPLTSHLQVIFVLQDDFPLKSNTYSGLCS